MLITNLHCLFCKLRQRITLGKIALSEEVVVTTDTWILDQSKQWLNLGAIIVDERIEKPELLVL